MREQKKRYMKCILWGQAHYQNQMMVTVRKEGKGGAPLLQSAASGEA